MCLYIQTFRHTLRLVLPLSFRESLLLCTWINRRNAVTMQCTNTPLSSYTTTNRFLESQAADKITMPTGVVRCSFDNNQIIGKMHIITRDFCIFLRRYLSTFTCYSIGFKCHNLANYNVNLAIQLIYQIAEYLMFAAIRLIAL